MKRLEKFSYLVDFLPKVSKIAALIGTVFGFVYLFAYTHEVGIPFPLQINVLPLTLLVTGLSAFAGVVILIVGTMIPALLADDPLDVTRDYLLARNVSHQRIKVRVFRWFGAVMVPMLLALISVSVLLMGGNNASPWYKATSGCLVFASLAWIAVTPSIIGLHKKRWSFISTIFLQTLFAVCGFAILIFVIVAVEPTVGKWPAWQGCALTISLFSPLYFFSTFPPEATSAIILLPPKFEYGAGKSLVVTIALALIIGVFSVLNYPINARIGEGVLYVLGIGGKVPVIVCIKPTANAAIGKFITLDANNCSQQLSLLFDGGDRIYVAPTASVANASTEKQAPIGIRQEDILMKSYPRAARVIR